jgi:hypothetical protein
VRIETDPSYCERKLREVSSDADAYVQRRQLETKKEISQFFANLKKGEEKSIQTD